MSTDTLKAPLTLDEQRQYSDDPDQLRRVLKQRGSDCEHPSGYWINEPNHFRCYTCGCQVYMDEREEEQERDIEHWNS